MRIEQAGSKGQCRMSLNGQQRWTFECSGNIRCDQGNAQVKIFLHPLERLNEQELLGVFVHSHQYFLLAFLSQLNSYIVQEGIPSRTASTGSYSTDVRTDSGVDRCLSRMELSDSDIGGARSQGSRTKSVYHDVISSALLP